MTIHKHFDPSVAKEEDSSKLESLLELMEEVTSGEHRALIFTQSIRMLNILEYILQKKKYQTLRLDGSTPPASRQILVNNFNENPSIDAFLISTKAGGTGLNLTGADTVIFYDHSWNPAHDQQAQDRAYRIGQKKDVTVYKLVSKGTIEEKVLKRQDSKTKISDSIIGVDEHGIKDISKEELLELFEVDF